MKECQAYRASVNKMGFIPPEGMVDPRELNRFYANVIKVAPLRCFNCNQEGPMKLNCPALTGNPSGQGSMSMGQQPVVQQPIVQQPSCSRLRCRSESWIWMGCAQNCRSHGKDRWTLLRSEHWTQLGE